MANQPKKYKKFLATAATATLVASAITPVAFAADFSDIAGNTHADAIKSLADQGIVNGYADGTFKPNTQINRGQTVKLLGRWLEKQGYEIPSNWNEVQRFNDVPVTAEEELVKYAALVKDAGVFNGSNGNLNYNQPMQRQQMAVVLTRAIDTVLGVDLVAEYKAADFTTSIKDLDKAFSAENREAIVALEYAGITVVENFNPANTVTRGQFASFLHRTIETNAEANVVSVEATSTTTLTVKGSALKTLTADDVTVSDNTVESFTASTDGRTATIKLGTSLVDGEEATVKIAGKEFKVSYKVEAKKVTVKEATYDDDTAKQSVALVVDGKQLTGTDLIAAGYDVQFAAYSDKKGITTIEDFFDNEETGVLADNLDDVLGSIPTAGKDVYVTVTVTKGSDVIVSELTKITIKNLDLATEKINSVKIVDDSTSYEKLSNILVPGETLSVDELKISVDKNEEEVTSGFTVKSSNPAVIAVSNDTDLTALTPGKATLTIKYGNVTKTVNYEVKNGTRELKSITVVEKDKVDASRISSITLADGSAKNSVYLKGLDQFGDLVDLNDIDGEGTIVKAYSSDEDVVSVADTLTDNVDPDKVNGIFELELTAGDKGSAYITFKTDEGFRVSSNTFKVNVSENATPSVYKLELDKDYESEDFKLNVADEDDDKLKLELFPYTSENVKLGAVELTAENVEVVQTTNVISTEVTDGSVIVTAEKEGTATVKVTYNGKVYTQKVTVVDEPTTIKSVDFKALKAVKYAKEFSYKDVFTYTESGNDTILKGITVTPASSQPVRIQEDNGLIYLDKNADGKFDENDVELGTFGISFVDVDGGVTDAALTYEVESGDEGTLLFTIVDDEDKVIASTSVEVDI